VPSDVVLRIRSSRYLFPASRRGGKSGDFLVRATCDSIAGASDPTPRKLGVGASGAGTLSIPAAVSPMYGRCDGGTGAQLKQSGQQRHRRLVALGVPSIAHCPQTLAQDGVRGGITFLATDRSLFTANHSSRSRVPSRVKGSLFSRGLIWAIGIRLIRLPISVTGAVHRPTFR
jgi:hypothetical protein